MYGKRSCEKYKIEDLYDEEGVKVKEVNMEAALGGGGRLWKTDKRGIKNTS